MRVGAAPATWRGGGSQLGAKYPIAGDGTRCQPDHARAEAAAATAAAAAAAVGEQTLEFDEIILACPADVARTLLGDGASFMERQVLSSVEYFYDLTVTHTDDDYMAEHNDVDGRAIYFIRTHEEKPECLEMGFELTAYQPKLKEYRAKTGQAIYQTIFLDKARSSLWSIDKLRPSKVLDRAWWSAFSHTYKHFRYVVPWVDDPGKQAHLVRGLVDSVQHSRHRHRVGPRRRLAARRALPLRAQRTGSRHV